MFLFYASQRAGSTHWFENTTRVPWTFPQTLRLRFPVQGLDMGTPGDTSRFLLDITALAP